MENGPSLKVLVIEPDISVLAGLEANFSSHGCAVVSSETGQHLENIVSLVKINKPDLIVIEPNIMNGYSLLGSIRADDNIKDIIIFVYSNANDEDSRERALNLGANYIFSKNKINIEDFVTKVIKIFENKNKIT